MKRKFMKALSAATLALAWMAFAYLPLVAETIQSNGNDGVNASSFDTGAIFGGAPHPTSGNDYEVVLGNLIRTPNINGATLAGATNIVFRGDSLSLGNEDSSGQMAFKSYYTDDAKRVTVTIGDFRLHDSAWLNNANDNSKVFLAGAIAVYASNANPADISTASKSGCVFEIASSVSGAATTGIMFSKSGQGSEFIMSGDMSQYLGSVTTDNSGFRLVLACPYAAASTTVDAANYLTLGPNFSYVGTGSMAIPAGTRFVAAYDAGSGTTVPVVLDSTHFTLASGLFEIALDASSLPDSADYAGKKLPVVKIPSALRQVSEADFTDVTSGAPVESGLPVRSILVETDGAGMQTVCLSVRQYVKVAESTQTETSRQSDGKWYLDDGDTWSDGASPSNAKDYLVQLIPKGDLRARGDDYVFPGNSLTLKEGMRLGLKGKCLTVSNLTLAAGAAVSSSSSGVMALDGTMRLMDTSTSAPALVWVTDANGIDLRSALSGGGTLKFVRPSGSGGSLMYVKLSGDNSAFAGEFQFAREKSASSRIVFDSPENLGGPLGAFTYNALTLGACCSLEPTSPMTLDTANRGIYFSGDGIVIAVTNGTFGIMQKIRMTNEITKEGIGVLALGGEVSFGANGTTSPNGSNNSLNVTEGGILPLTTNGFARLAIKLGAGARLVADAVAADANVRTFGLFNTYGAFTLPSDGKLHVTIANVPESAGDFSVALCTVTQSAAAALTDNVVVDRVAGKSVAVRHESVSVNGQTMVRFVADMTNKGFIIIFR